MEVSSAGGSRFEELAMPNPWARVQPKGVIPGWQTAERTMPTHGNETVRVGAKFCRCRS